MAQKIAILGCSPDAREIVKNTIISQIHKEQGLLKYLLHPEFSSDADLPFKNILSLIDEVQLSIHLKMTHSKDALAIHNAAKFVLRFLLGVIGSRVEQHILLCYRPYYLVTNHDSFVNASIDADEFLIHLHEGGGDKRLFEFLTQIEHDLDESQRLTLSKLRCICNSNLPDFQHDSFLASMAAFLIAYARKDICSRLAITKNAFCYHPPDQILLLDPNSESRPILANLCGQIRSIERQIKIKELSLDSFENDEPDFLSYFIPREEGFLNRCQVIQSNPSHMH